MNKPIKLYKWEGAIYRVDLDAPTGEIILVKEDGKFISKPDLGKLVATILFEGIPIQRKKTGGKKE